MYLSGTHRSAAQRLRLTSNRSLGAGNFFWHACEVASDLDRPVVFRPGGPDARGVSLRALRERVESHANWYHAHGVTAGTRVAVYTGDGLLGLLHYVAVTSLGAVAVMTNPNMAPHVAVRYFAASGVTVLAADESRLRMLPNAWPDGRPTTEALTHAVDIETVRRTGGWAGGPPPRPHRHRDDDLVMISHSSGTTGVPKPTSFTHRGFFVGKRERLWRFPSERSDRLLTALPHSHSAGLSYASLALLLGIPTTMVDDPSGRAVAEAMNTFLPTVVVAFPGTLADLRVEDLSDNARECVHTWMGMGDASHERHIRPLVEIGRTRARDGWRPGSTYVDGLGSSEMGMVLFRQAHTATSRRFDRVIGRPVPVVRRAAVLDTRGNELPDGQAGLLGVRTPSTTPGYVNAPELDEQARSGGYLLTGDVVRRVNGTWYHLDRTPDVIVTEQGPVYSLPVEEVVLMETQALDAAVVAVDDPKAEGFARPVAVVLFKDRERAAEQVLARCNTVLARRGLPLLEAVVVAADRGALPVGVTGKVLKRVLRERHRTILGGPPEPGAAIAVRDGVPS
jgi:acyl-coenzyme A synthetase/AMP-(fatty) acid ligase